MTSPTKEYREIPLTRGMVAIVDKDDFDFLVETRWKAVFDRHTGGYYANRSHSKGELMHRMILGLQQGDGKMVDHINGNALDNRRANLRIATNRQNQHNRRLGKDNSSGYKGVSWSKSAKK